ncbi:vascular endothelial growth factor A isoform X8 [Rana temporaria]|uniref:vascular endothelial growth factor A isoform X8 n=1 Tax=Rana temporaria TaxID=8407 RepID=UPI001AAD747E|nr:vascular endothelial growth factor A isoform X8 [Rana temporaria]
MLLGTMNFLLSVLWGLPFLLSIHTAQLSQAAPTHGKEHKSTQVVPFMEVYDRSMCQVREILVDVLQEYPDEVEYIFKPSCVPLMRCAGCCTDETLECVPTGWHNITMQILRVHSRFGANYLEKSFQQHSRCECRPKNEIKGQQEKKAKRGKGLKRKRKKIRYKSHRLFWHTGCSSIQHGAWICSHSGFSTLSHSH